MPRHSPALIHLPKQKHYRIIPSTYPPINFFEDLVDPAEMETLWEIESLTNERLRQDVGDIFLVSPDDRISGPGSSVVMAAFTHIGRPSRFTDGSYGVYYASLSYETAIKETVYHRELFLKATNEAALELTMRSYEGTILQDLHDIRKDEFNYLHDPINYSSSQDFGRKMREEKSWGLIYNSVRHQAGQCIAAFKPRAISIPKPLAHLRYVWNGKKITEVFDTTLVIKLI
jgi:hypothetical protein